MARRSGSGRFLLGLAAGAATGCVLLLLPTLWIGPGETAALYARILPPVQGLWELINTNLRGSLLPFVAIGVAFWWQLRRLGELLSASEPALDRVLRHEQLLDLCANLFFGVGVIWTAIGMRQALLYALGDPAASAEAGAFAILQRLVDGGILLALSTTIVGGIGGYLMRVIKSVALGRELNALYMQASERPALDSLETLRRIERRLGAAPADVDQV